MLKPRRFLTLLLAYFKEEAQLLRTYVLTSTGLHGILHYNQVSSRWGPGSINTYTVTLYALWSTVLQMMGMLRTHQTSPSLSALGRATHDFERSPLENSQHVNKAIMLLVTSLLLCAIELLQISLSGSPHCKWWVESTYTSNFRSEELPCTSSHTFLKTKKS